MHVVAITRLTGSTETEARALAQDLGTIAYEERLKLGGGVPAVVLATPDADRAHVLLAKLRARRHDAVCCDTSDVVASSAMVALRRFQLGDDALVAGDRRLPWRDIAVFVRATHRISTEKTAQVTHKQLAIGRAIATGGLVMRKNTTSDVVTRTTDHEPVLYVFRRDRGTPWLLREQGTQFAGLGADATPIASRNFQLAVDRLRALAPEARFDDRLVARKGAPDDLDLLAHLIAVAP